MSTKSLFFVLICTLINCFPQYSGNEHTKQYWLLDLQSTVLNKLQISKLISMLTDICAKSKIWNVCEVLEPIFTILTDTMLETKMVM